MHRLRSALLSLPGRLSVVAVAILMGFGLTAAAQTTASAPPAALGRHLGGIALWRRPLALLFPPLVDSTLREIVHTSIAGKALRVRFTNEFGTEPLRIDAANIALSAGESAIQPDSLHTLTFGGQPSIVIPAGAEAVSDPVEMATPAFANLAISLYLPLQQISNVSVHSSAQQINYIQAGSNVVSAPTLADATTVPSWYFVKGVDVEPRGSACRRGGCLWRLHHGRSIRNRQRKPSLARLPRGAPAQRSCHRAPVGPE